MGYQPPYAPGGYQPSGYPPGQPPSPPQPQARGSSLPRWLIGAGLALLLVAGGYAIYASSNDNGGAGTATAVAIAPKPTPTPRPTPTQRAQTRPTSTPRTEVEPTPAEVVPALEGAAGRLIFVSPNDFSLVSMPASGGDETKLSFEDPGPFYSNEARISPDGQRALRFDRKGNGVELFISDGDGTNIKAAGALTATVPYDLIWSPDSSKVAFIVSDADSGDNSEQNLFVIDAASGTLRQFTTQGYLGTEPLAWSLDSGKLLFAVADTNIALHAINADGSDDRKLIDSITVDAGWLPDGRIMYDDYCDETGFERSLCVLDPQSGSVEPFMALGDNFFSGLSPDGTWAMLENYSDGSLSLLSIETKETEIVVPPQTGENVEFNYWSVWSPDSAYVTYHSTTNYITYAYRIGSDKPAVPLTSETLFTWIP